jgi:hypothetical protein
MTEAQTHLRTVITHKKAASAQFVKNAGVSGASLERLVSAPPPKSTISGASSAPESAATDPAPATTTVYTGTVVETVTGPAPTTTTVVTTTTSVPTPLPATTAPATPAALPPYIPPDTYSRRKINWVPILAVGIPAAVLTAIVVSKLSKNHVGGAPAPEDSGGGTGSGTGSGPTGGSPDGSTMPNGGSRNPTPSTIPGGGDLAAWKVTVDPSFTDRERAIIAMGFAKIPACYRYKLQGLYIKNQKLPRTSNGCVAGMFRFGGNTVYLSPSCTVAIGVTVHELFHVIGNRNNNAVHRQWKPVSDAHPNCPVTTYGGTNFYEDFAESGRLLEYPDSSAEAKNPGACVDAKIQGLGKIMTSCPQ